MSRLGYLKENLAEMRTIQISIAQKVTSTKVSFIHTLLNAYAGNGINFDMFSDSNNGLHGNPHDLDALDATENIDQLNNSINALNNNMTLANTNWDGTNAQIGVSNQNWAQTNTQIGNSNVNWNNSNQQMAESNKNWAESNRVMDKNWAESNRVMDKNWSDTNKEYARTNDIMEKMSDPNHMFNLAAASAAGAVIGATVANLVIDGIVWGAKKVWDLITDASGKKDRWKKFKAARKEWEKSLSKARDLEKLIDSFLNSRNILNQIKDKLPEDQKSGLSRANLINHLRFNLRRAKKNKKKLESKFDEAETYDCELFYEKKLSNVEEAIGYFTPIEQFLQKQNFKEYNDKIFCNQLDTITGKLIEAEAKLQEYRIHILNGRAQWEDFNQDRNEELIDAIRRINDEDTQENFFEKRVDNAEDLFEEVESIIKKRRKNFIYECSHKLMKKENSFFMDEDDKDRLMNKLEDRCEAQYNKSSGEKDKRVLQKAKEAQEKKVALAKKDYKQSQSQTLDINTEVMDQEMSVTYKWFKDLEQQQHCYTDPDDKLCKEMEKSKFNGTFSVKDKAITALKDICSNTEYAY